MDIPKIIKDYSKKKIFIEILADGYKIEGMGICWRGYVYWNEKGEWVEEDCGCFPEWGDAFKSVLGFIENHIVK